MVFKKGDKVKVKAGKTDISKKLDERIGIIIEVCDGYCHLDIEKELDSYGGLWNKELELISNKLKPTHIILWNNVYHIVYGRKDRDEKIKELVDNIYVDNDSITVFNIKSESKVSCEVIVEKIKNEKDCNV